MIENYKIEGRKWESIKMVDRTVRDAEARKLKELYEAKKSQEELEGNSFNQQTIATEGGWTQPNVSAYLRGVVEIKEEAALVFAKCLEVPISAFSPRIANRMLQRELMAKNPSAIKAKVTLVPKLNAATLDAVRDKLKDTSLIMPISEATTPINKPLSNNAFSFDLSDNSMSPKYQAGTSFVFDPMIKPLPTNIVIAAHKTRMGEYIIREYCVVDVLEDGQDVYELKPLNTAFPTLRDNYEVLAVAVAVVDMLI